MDLCAPLLFHIYLYIHHLKKKKWKQERNERRIYFFTQIKQTERVSSWCVMPGVHFVGLHLLGFTLLLVSPSIVIGYFGPSFLNCAILVPFVIPLCNKRVPWFSLKFPPLLVPWMIWSCYFSSSLIVPNHRGCVQLRSGGLKLHDHNTYGTKSWRKSTGLLFCTREKY